MGNKSQIETKVQYHLYALSRPPLRAGGAAHPVMERLWDAAYLWRNRFNGGPLR